MSFSIMISELYATWSVNGNCRYCVVVLWIVIISLMIIMLCFLLIEWPRVECKYMTQVHAAFYVKSTFNSSEVLKHVESQWLTKVHTDMHLYPVSEANDTLKGDQQMYVDGGFHCHVIKLFKALS